MSEFETLKQAAMESVHGPSEPTEKPIQAYSRDEVRQLLEDVLNQDVLQREIEGTSEAVADRIREALWPEFQLEAKKKVAEKKVERKALLMHLKELIGEANGRSD